MSYSADKGNPNLSPGRDGDRGAISQKNMLINELFRLLNHLFRFVISQVQFSNPAKVRESFRAEDFLRFFRL